MPVAGGMQESSAELGRGVAPSVALVENDAGLQTAAVFLQYPGECDIVAPVSLGVPGALQRGHTWGSAWIETGNGGVKPSKTDGPSRPGVADAHKRLDGFDGLG